MVVVEGGGASDEEGVRSSTGRKFGKTRTVARARAEEQKTRIIGFGTLNR